MSLKEPKTYSLFVIQVGEDPKTIYVGETWVDPKELFDRYIENSDKKTTPKALRNKKLTLRLELCEENSKFSSMNAAIDHRFSLSEELVDKGFKVLSKVSRRAKIKINKSKFSDDVLARQSTNYDSANKDYKGDIFHYGRSKTQERERSAEYVEELRNRKIAPITSGPVTPKATQKSQVPTIDIKESQISDFKSDKILELTERFSNLNELRQYLEKVAGKSPYIELVSRGRFKSEINDYIVNVHSVKSHKKGRKRLKDFILSIKKRP